MSALSIIHSYVILFCYSSLLTQLKQLQAIVSSTHPSKTQAGTCLMVLILAFGLVVFPLSNNKDHQSPSVSSYATTSGKCFRETYPTVTENYNVQVFALYWSIKDRP